MKRTFIILSAVLILLWSVTAVAGPPIKAEQYLAKESGTADIDFQTWIDANQLLMFVTNQGSFAYDNGAILGKADGLYFPKGTNLSVIYAGGIWLGGKVDGDLRVTLAEYSHDYWPGPLDESGNFVANANQDSQYRVYKISKDLLNQGFYDAPRPSDPDEARLWDDYHEWPSDMGAPLGDDGLPKMIGDQTLWCVYNDANPASRTNSAGTVSSGLGVEIQQTTFAFNRTGSLGQCAFMDFRVINKSGNRIEDMFISVWADPDLGDAGDDLVGSDTELSLGYCYNATNNDANYGKKPPAVGYDFFQGPIVPDTNEADGIDSVYFLDEWVHGYTSLPMTSFNQYINGTDPDNADETYWYMQGLDAKNSGADLVNPITGEVTKFMFPGDPTTGEGWLDSDPADRRYMQSTGPFTMEPGDTQQVVVGVVVGLGSDRLTSITALKFNDLFAQSAFDAQFDLPDPPARPQVTGVPVDDGIVLNWADDSETNPGDYEFQGYNVYQGESVAGPWKRVATYDLNDGTGIIFDLEFVIDEGAVIDHPVQFGSDTGVRRFVEFTQDFIQGGSLHNAMPYHWAVTAYSYDPNRTPKTLENAPEAITVTPQKPAGGYVYPHEFGEVLEVTHESGASDGIIEPIVRNPEALNGHSYRITFTEDEEGNVLWNLFDLDSNIFLFENLANQSGDDDYPVVDGFQIKVAGPPLGVNTVLEVATADGPLDPENYDNVFWSWNSDHTFYTSSDQGPDIERLNWRGHIGTDDWEIRFTAEGSEYYDWFTWDDNVNLKYSDRAPFEVWNIGSATPDDPSDDRRINFVVIDDDESWGEDGSGPGWTPGDRIYFIETDYVESGPDHLEFGVDYDWDGDFKLGRIQINADVPPEGTIIRYTTNKVNATDDVFTFTTPAVVKQDLAADDAYDMADIKVVPNPYFNQSLYEPDQFTRILKFTNLPYECEIKIFNLAGDHVVTLNKPAGSASNMEWNMLTKHGLPLASGLYLYIVTAPDGGEYVGKFAVFTETEQLNTF